MIFANVLSICSVLVVVMLICDKDCLLHVELAVFQFCWVVSGGCLRIIESLPRSLLCALHASQNRSAIESYLPLLEHCAYKKGKVLVCVSGVATIARSSTPPKCSRHHSHHSYERI